MHRNDESPQATSSKVTIDLSSYPAKHGQPIAKNEENFDLGKIFMTWGPIIGDYAYIGGLLFMLELHKSHNRPTNPTIVMQSQDIVQDLRLKRKQKWAISEATEDHVGKIFLNQGIGNDDWVEEKKQSVGQLNIWKVALGQLSVICFTEEDAIAAQKNLNQWAQRNDIELLTQIPYKFADSPPRGEPTSLMLVIPLEEPDAALGKEILSTMLAEHNQQRAAIITMIDKDAKLNEFFKVLINRKFGYDTAKNIGEFNLDNSKLLLLCQDYMLMSAARNEGTTEFTFMVNNFLRMNNRILELGQEFKQDKKALMAHDQQFNAEINSILSQRLSADLQQPVKSYLDKKLAEINLFCVREGLSLNAAAERRSEMLSALREIDFIQMRKSCKSDSASPKSALFSPDAKDAIDSKKIEAYLNSRLGHLTQPRSAAAAAAIPPIRP